MRAVPVPFFSSALYQRKTCYVYLPPGYEHSGVSYPVIYLLHGLYGSESDWEQKGGASQTLTAMIKSGEIRPCIAVMPSDGGYGHGTYYTDWYDGTGNFEDYFISDLVPFIDAEFRTIADRSQRFIAGLSMGGYGAFALALRNPHLFGAASSLSGALGSVSDMPQKDFDRSEFARIIGPRGGMYAKEQDLSVLAAMRMADELHLRPKLYFDCGREDYLYAHSAYFHHYLNKIGYEHEYHEFGGEHNWPYWSTHLPDTLRFFERQFPARHE